MGAKEDLISAARSLLDQGHERFSLVNVINEAKRLGCTYPDVTLRTMVSHHLRIDRGRVPGGVGFIQVSRGFYRLASSNNDVVSRRPFRSGDPDRANNFVEERVPPSDDGHEWFWEGNVQAAIVRHLASDGWMIRRVADTHSREHGIDIEADRSGVSLLMEVKGYPSARYLKGPNEGQKKRFGVGAQARTYFGSAVLSGLLMRSDNADARVVLVFPALETFRTLARRSSHPLGQAGIELWLVSEDGQVVIIGSNDQGDETGMRVSSNRAEPEITKERSKFEWGPEDIVILDPYDGEDDFDLEDPPPIKSTND